MNKTMTTISKLLMTALLISIIFGCKKDVNQDQVVDTDNNQNNNNTSTVPYGSGVFISCEGAFTGGNGTISFFNRQTKSVYNDIYAKENNNTPLGNIVQSITVYNNKAYIVVNNANKVEVANAGTMKNIATISGFKLPRYFVGVSATKAYVSEWNGDIKIIDLATNKIAGKIDCNTYPDRMIMVGTKLFVLNSAGYTSGIGDSTVSVINTTTDKIEKTFAVGINPSDAVIDKNGKLWIISDGYTDYTNAANNIKGKLVRINPTDNSVEKIIVLNDSYYCSRLAINKAKDKLYLLHAGGLFALEITSSTLGTTAYLNRSINSIGIDPIDGYLYITDKNYSAEGTIIRYDLTNKSKVDSFKVGIIPGYFYFN